MKQRKVKKELVLTTYWDYLKHFGREKGRKKWKEYKAEFKETKATTLTPKIIETADKLMVKKLEEGLEPIQEAVLGGTQRLDIRKDRGDIMSCGATIVEFIGTPAWNKYIKPQIQKDAVDFVRKALMLSGEESHKATGGYNYAQKILRTINKWVNDYTYLVREEEKKQNAIQAKR